MIVKIKIYPPQGGLPQFIDIEGPDALVDALVLDLRPTDAENVLKGGATEYSFDAPQTPSNRALFDDWQQYQRDAGTAYLYRDAVLDFTENLITDEDNHGYRAMAAEEPGPPRPIKVMTPVKYPKGGRQNKKAGG